MLVDCEAGYSGCGHPKSFFWRNRREIVRAIIKEWREPQGKHYLVAARAGGNFQLILDESSGVWCVLVA